MGTPESSPPVILQKYFPYDTKNLICNGLPHMGDGILMAWEIGAASDGLGNMVGGGPGLTRKRRGTGPAYRAPALLILKICDTMEKPCWVVLKFE
jgi:hypothetical protein